MNVMITIRKKFLLITMMFLSFGLIVTTTSCSDDSPEVVVGDKGDKGDEGLQGEKGDKGDKGVPGNANVKKYYVDVNASDWRSGLHYGNNIIHNTYIVEPSLTGGISISSSDYVVLAYAKPATGEYTENKQLPHTFPVNNNYGIVLNMIPSRSYLTISKTTNGFNSLDLNTNEIPAKVSFTIIMIEINALSAFKNEVDFNNVEAVSAYFKLD